MITLVQTGAEVTGQTSRQIVLCRVICIFFMMSVHVSPGYKASDWGAGMVMHWLGALWVDVLGRSSVPTLSLVSGFLIALQVGRKPFWGFAKARFQVLCIPMLFWNLLLALMVLLPFLLIGLETRNYTMFFDASWHEILFENLLFLYGHPANYPLAFMRDLFLCSLICFLTLRFLPWAILPAAIASVLIWQFGDYGPLFLRPAMLSFVLAGAAAAFHIGHLTPPRGLRLPIWTAFGLILAHYWFGVFAQVETQLSSALWQLVLRVVVTLWMLDCTALLARGQRGYALLKPFEPASYLSYLSHLVIIYTLWEGIEPAIGSAQSLWYPVFFLAMPPLVFVMARLALPVIERLPRWVQIALRGKARRAKVGDPTVPSTIGSLSA